MKNNIIICIAGWHYFKEFYKQVSRSKIRSFVVAHRHSNILDNLKINYAVTKNIGLEYGAYDWFIKNEWDKKSGVLFMHDDVKLLKNTILHNFLTVCKNFDRVYIIDKQRGKKLKRSPRCFYLSRKIIFLLLNKYNGICYDVHNKGYTMGNRGLYDDYYKDGSYKTKHEEGGVGFKGSLDAIEKKYDLKLTKIVSNKISLYRRGDLQDSIKGSGDTMLNDNSIFGRKDENVLENIAVKFKDHRRRELNYYTKWYDYYFSPMRLDNLTVLEISVKDDSYLNLWKKYFKNSDIYGISLKNVGKNIFVGDPRNKKFIEKISSKISTGFDIIIDNGSVSGGRVDLFESIFSYINPGGIYVFENLQKDSSVTSFLKNRIDDMNFNGRFRYNNIEMVDQGSLSVYEKGLFSIIFHPGICFIFKRF